MSPFDKHKARAMAERTIHKKNGEIVSHEEKNLLDDDELKALRREDGAATVAANVGFGLPFGEMKCAILVSLSCDQNDPTLEKAKDAAAERAMVWADETMKKLIELVAKNSGQ